VLVVDASADDEEEEDDDDNDDNKEQDEAAALHAHTLVLDGQVHTDNGNEEKEGEEDDVVDEEFELQTEERLPRHSTSLLFSMLLLPVFNCLANQHKYIIILNLTACT